MAKKKINISTKINLKKPVKNAKKAADNLAKVRNSERSKLYRLEKQFDNLPRKGTKKIADKLRKEIKAQTKAVDKLRDTVKGLRGTNKSIENIKSYTKSLRLKNSAINRKIKSLKGKDNAKERDNLRKQFHRNANLIHGKEKQINELLYNANKIIGFKPETIADDLGLSKKYLEKNHAEDFEPDYFDEILGADEETGKPLESEEEIEQEIIEEEVVDEGWIVEMHEIFWEVWQNFDKVEDVGQNLATYDKVIFEFEHLYSEFKGTSISLIQEKAKEVWAMANAKPPYVRAIKSVSANRKKLKYYLYQD